MYIKAMGKKATSKYPAWTPNIHFELGDYGTLEKGIFIRLGNVIQLGENFRFVTQEGPSTPNVIYSSGIKKENIVDGGGNIDVLTKIKIATNFSIEFSNEGSFVYEAAEVRTNRISDVAALGAEIKEYRGLKNVRRKWQDHYVVITEIDVAESATFILSNAKGVKINCTVNGNIPLDEIRLADPALGLKVKSTTGIVSEMQFLAAKDTTPFFRLRGLKRKFGQIGGPLKKNKLQINSKMSVGISDSDAENRGNSTVEILDFVAVKNCETWTGVEETNV